MGVGVDPEGGVGVGVGAAHGEGAGVGAEGETPEAGHVQEEGQGLVREGGEVGAGLDLREGVATGIRVRFRSGRKAEAEAETGGMTGKMKERKLHQLCPERSQKKDTGLLGSKTGGAYIP